MAKRSKRQGKKKHVSRNPIAVAHQMRGGAGAGRHRNRVRRARQVPRVRKHKGDRSFSSLKPS